MKSDYFNHRGFPIFLPLVSIVFIGATLAVLVSGLPQKFLLKNLAVDHTQNSVCAVSTCAGAGYRSEAILNCGEMFGKKAGCDSNPECKWDGDSCTGKAHQIFPCGNFHDQSSCTDPRQTIDVKVTGSCSWVCTKTQEQQQEENQFVQQQIQAQSSARSNLDPKSCRSSGGTIGPAVVQKYRVGKSTTATESCDARQCSDKCCFDSCQCNGTCGAEQQYVPPAPADSSSGQPNLQGSKDCQTTAPDSAACAGDKAWGDCIQRTNGDSVKCGFEASNAYLTKFSELKQKASKSDNPALELSKLDQQTQYDNTETYLRRAASCKDQFGKALPDSECLTPGKQVNLPDDPKELQKIVDKIYANGQGCKQDDPGYAKCVAKAGQDALKISAKTKVDVNTLARTGQGGNIDIKATCNPNAATHLTGKQRFGKEGNYVYLNCSNNTLITDLAEQKKIDNAVLAELDHAQVQAVLKACGDNKVGFHDSANAGTCYSCESGLKANCTQIDTKIQENYLVEQKIAQICPTYSEDDASTLNRRGGSAKDVCNVDRTKVLATIRNEIYASELEISRACSGAGSVMDISKCVDSEKKRRDLGLPVVSREIALSSQAQVKQIYDKCSGKEGIALSQCLNGQIGSINVLNSQEQKNIFNENQVAYSCINSTDPKCQEKTKAEIEKQINTIVQPYCQSIGFGGATGRTACEKTYEDKIRQGVKFVIVSDQSGSPVTEHSVSRVGSEGMIVDAPKFDPATMTIAISSDQVKKRCGVGSGVGNFDGQYYDCSTGFKLSSFDQSRITTGLANAQQYCNDPKRVSANGLREGDCVRKLQAVVFGGNSIDTSGVVKNAKGIKLVEVNGVWKENVVGVSGGAAEVVLQGTAGVGKEPIPNLNAECKKNPIYSDPEERHAIGCDDITQYAERWCTKKNGQTNGNAFGASFEFTSGVGKVTTRGYCFSFDPQQGDPSNPNANKYMSTRGGYFATVDSNPVSAFEKVNCDLSDQGSRQECEKLKQDPAVLEILSNPALSPLATVKVKYVNVEEEECDMSDQVARQECAALPDSPDSPPKLVLVNAYIHDNTANTTDGISNNFLKFLGGQSDNSTFGVISSLIKTGNPSLGQSLDSIQQYYKFPDCSPSSSYATSDTCVEFRKSLKSWMETNGIPPDTYPGKCDGENGTGWWTKEQCVKLAQYISKETNLARVWNRNLEFTKILAPVGTATIPDKENPNAPTILGLKIPTWGQAIKGSSEVALPFVGGFLFQNGIGTILPASKAAPVIAGIYLGSAIGEEVNNVQEKAQIQQILNLPCDIDGSEAESVYFACNGDPKKKNALAERIKTDLSKSFVPFEADPKELNYFTAEQILEAAEAGSKCESRSQTYTCLTDDQRRALKEFDKLTAEYAKYLVSNGSGVGSLTSVNEAIDEAKLSIGLSILGAVGGAADTTEGAQAIKTVKENLSNKFPGVITTYKSGVEKVSKVWTDIATPVSKQVEKVSQKIDQTPAAKFIFKPVVRAQEILEAANDLAEENDSRFFPALWEALHQKPAVVVQSTKASQKGYFYKFLKWWYSDQIDELKDTYIWDPLEENFVKLFVGQFSLSGDSSASN